MRAAESSWRRWATRTVLGAAVLTCAASACLAQPRARGEKPKLSKALAGAILKALGVESEEEPSATGGAAVVVERRADEPDFEADPAWQPALEEVRTIDVEQGWKPYTVNNLGIDANGNLLVACGGERVEYEQRQGELEIKIHEVPGEIRVFNAEGKLLRTLSVPLSPEALAVLPDGTMFVGGGGKVARLDAEGNVLKIIDSPAMRGRAERGKEAEGDQTRALSAAPDGGENAGGADKPTQLDPKRKRMEETRAKMIEQRRKTVPGIAASERDVFVACPEAKGYGYAVWRFDHNLEHPKEIVDKLRGCCGQMDIRTHGGDLYVAENARHRVVRYDRQGKRLASFGRRDRRAADGFGGCCEPKNLYFTAEGELLTSESGPPVAVKRFTLQGELIEVVAVPTFETGCVRVSVAQDLEGRVFLLNGGENKVLVFEETGPKTTHRQVATIQIGGEESRLRIVSFCLGPRGRLLTACQSTSEADKGLVRVLSPDGKRLADWELDFPPQAINVMPDGGVLVGGAGSLAILSDEGEVLRTADSPALVAMLPALEDFLPGGEESAEAQARQMEEYVETLKKQLDSNVTLMLGDLDKSIQSARDKGDTERVKTLEEQKARTQAMFRESMKRRLKQFEERLGALKKESEAQRRMSPAKQRRAAQEALEKARDTRRRASRVSGVAATDRDVFVACYSRRGFAVYRLSHELADGEKIVTRLRGCCGQMDIQAHGGDLYVAENGRFRVVRYDRDGKELDSWGKRSRTAEDGFGSCCNPMNIRFDPGGKILTSEASVGAIKRFDLDGSYLGTVARSKIVPGCKHVAIDISDDGRRLYMLDITRSQIVVMERKGSAKRVAAR